MWLPPSPYRLPCIDLGTARERNHGRGLAEPVNGVTHRCAGSVFDIDVAGSFSAEGVREFLAATPGEIVAGFKQGNIGVELPAGFDHIHFSGDQ